MKTKRCPKCCDVKNIKFFMSKKSGRVQSYCKECRNIVNREVKRDPEKYEKFKESVHKSYAKLRRQVIEAYGAKCACCGEATYEFLTIDHVFNDGYKERQNTHYFTLLRKIRDRGYPDSYQCLCFNCNCAKGIFGECPHQQKG